MRHLKSGRKFGRNSSHRKAMFRNMVTSLLLHGQIKTTLAKAKELRSYVEKIITLAGNNAESSFEGLDADMLVSAKSRRLNGIRKARTVVNNKEALQRLFDEYAERYKNRPGGYTRVIKAGYRPGDNAPMAYICLVEDDDVKEVDASDESSDVSDDVTSDSTEAVESE
jgi:large subunit ribosomal protein L17